MEIQGFQDYLIYPDGRVWSKPRNGTKGGFLKPWINHNYYRVGIGNKQPFVHRLIAEHYIPNPENKPEVDHKNRNTLDNSIENLRWVNHSEQMLNRKIIKQNNSSRFIWIKKDRNSWCFKRKGHKSKCSKSIPKLLCYSFFYILKDPPVF
jgi:hypothetical protein